MGFGGIPEMKDACCGFNRFRCGMGQSLYVGKMEAEWIRIVGAYVEEVMIEDISEGGAKVRSGSHSGAAELSD